MTFKLKILKLYGKQQNVFKNASLYNIINIISVMPSKQFFIDNSLSNFKRF